MSSFSFQDLDDNEFQMALPEFANGGSIRYDDLEFNPLLCESYNNFSLCKDLNPDSNLNFFNDIGSCNIIEKTASTIRCLKNRIV